MTKLEQCLKYCDDHHISIHRVPLTTNQKAFALKVDESKNIFIDNNEEYTDRELFAYAIHEAGHFETNSLYPPYTPTKLRKAHERRAAVWAINVALPKHKLKKCIEKGMECWEMADEFGVPERMIRFAVDYYFQISGVWDGKLAVAGEASWQ